jgi:hypothetical protein
MWVFLFLVSLKHFQFLDHSMTIKNYSFIAQTHFNIISNESFNVL